jgi:transposase
LLTSYNPLASGMDTHTSSILHSAIRSSSQQARNRMFECDDCGAVLDRDVNAARNILGCGLATLGGGTPPKTGNSGLQAGE